MIKESIRGRGGGGRGRGRGGAKPHQRGRGGKGPSIQKQRKSYTIFRKIDNLEELQKKASEAYKRLAGEISAFNKKQVVVKAPGKWQRNIEELLALSDDIVAFRPKLPYITLAFNSEKVLKKNLKTIGDKSLGGQPVKIREMADCGAADLHTDMKPQSIDPFQVQVFSVPFGTTLSDLHKIFNKAEEIWLLKAKHKKELGSARLFFGKCEDATACIGKKPKGMFARYAILHETQDKKLVTRKNQMMEMLLKYHGQHINKEIYVDETSEVTYESNEEQQQAVKPGQKRPNKQDKDSEEEEAVEQSPAKKVKVEVTKKSKSNKVKAMEVEEDDDESEDDDDESDDSNDEDGALKGIEKKGANNEEDDDDDDDVESEESDDDEYLVKNSAKKAKVQNVNEKSLSKKGKVVEEVNSDDDDDDDSEESDDEDDNGMNVDQDSDDDDDDDDDDDE